MRIKTASQKHNSRSRGPRSLRRRTMAFLLSGLRIRISPGAWLSLSLSLSLSLFQGEVYATGRSLVRTCPTRCVRACVCVIECDQVQQ
jgi:hypothetical protein